MRKLLIEEIEAYHRAPHRGHGMNGKSPMAVYTELMNAPGYVPKVISQRQFRRCVLSAIKVTLRQDGSFAIHKARYYSEATARLPVAKVVELTHTAAEVSRESTQSETEAAARIKAMAEEMNSMTAGTLRRVGKH